MLDFGPGMPICRLVQTAGRASGEQKELLKKNGFDGRVVILTNPFDYDTIQARSTQPLLLACPAPVS